MGDDDQDAAADDSTAADEAASAPSADSGDEARETSMVGHLQEGDPDSFTGSGDTDGMVTFSDALQDQEPDYFQKDDSGGSTENKEKRSEPSDDES